MGLSARFGDDQTTLSHFVPTTTAYSGSFIHHKWIMTLLLALASILTKFKSYFLLKYVHHITENTFNFKTV